MNYACMDVFLGKSITEGYVTFETRKEKEQKWQIILLSKISKHILNTHTELVFM